MNLEIHRTRYYHSHYGDGLSYSGNRRVPGWTLGSRIKYEQHPSGAVDMYFEMYQVVHSTRFLWWGNDAGVVYNWVHESDIEITQLPTKVIYECS